MTEHKNTVGKNGQFASRLGFILASVGSAVGMGNIWMFPYRVGQYGGAAFLLIYFGFIALFGMVGLSGEFAFGRLTRTGPIGSYDYAMKTRGKKGGAYLGAIPLVGSLGIAIGYAIIVGWVLRYLFGSLSGVMLKTEASEYFSQSTGHFGSVPWHFLVVLLTVLILSGGVTKGIEKINRIIMPVFFILFVLIAGRVFFLPGSMEGYKYLFIPRWELLMEPKTWIMAMGQAFFSLSITGSGMIIYGSYLDKKEDVQKAALMTALLDTVAAMLAGLAIIPAVFAFQMDPASGPPLMFITLPKVFGQIPGGRLVAAVFFLSVLFAGVTSLVNMFEVCAEAAQTHLKLNRRAAVLAVGAVVFLVGLFIEYEPYMGTWMDIITIYVVPFGAVLCAIMIYWVLGTEKIGEELNSGREKPIGKAYNFTAKYVYVVLTVLVCILSVVYKGIG
ncbi:sodium-dependent transporter [Clostridium sp. AM58-1XD]|uniref:sodium-dependent transporter n=1 Tax=Clostridium sp. AM58-1XD TaxID=2292307 RepID=UPI000E556D69|nr:sodium-dependent transporter [Clostridium sp. AM58-1XD]RGY97481.1 sodium-dependent transporter [Clostridium sp. AM58-1XD]